MVPTMPLSTLTRVVPQADDAVADLEESPVHIESRTRESAGSIPTSAGQPVQRSGLGTGTGQHHDVNVTFVVQVHPVGQQSGAHGVGLLEHFDGFVLFVDRPGGGDVAVSKLFQGLVFPHLPLSAVYRQLAHSARRPKVGERHLEPAASGHLGQLMLVTHNHQPST